MNRLIHESSPYLQQHAHNPVDWYPWGEEALKKAREENKPILVSIGYSACHWCHVMERESFEDEKTASLMNEHFVNIKIDREERPDLDHIYMDAVQAMTGSGGWPLNVFLTPEGKPFYGGTYFPPASAYNRPSWQNVLMGVWRAFSEKRNEIDAQAENLTEHLLQSNAFGVDRDGKEEWVRKERIDEAYQNILRTADTEWGGFGRAPKFPQTFTIQFLLRYAAENSNIGERNEKDPAFPALLSLDKMIAGGIYDHVGGGFARYSTDIEWLVPHFEKMLYDNALLISALSEAYQYTGKELYSEVIGDTFDFLQREMMDGEGGFYAALDADSEGEEGKFYVWTKKEVDDLLGEDSMMFCAYYDITEKGNWEGKNIPRTKVNVEEFAREHNMDPGVLKEKLKRGVEILLEERNKRVRPGLDDKVILGWNALLNMAASKAFAATGHELYRQLALQNMRFMLENFSQEGTIALHHSWKKGEGKYPAFLDDYAFLIEALLYLQEITGDTGWLRKAEDYARYVIDEFGEEETGFFFFTGKGQTDVIVRKKEIYDGAVPSGNSVMAYNLYRLSLLFDLPAWRKRSEVMVNSLGKVIVKYPTSFGVWASLLQEITAGTNEIAVIGQDPWNLQRELQKLYLPHKVLMTTAEEKKWPLLDGKPVSDVTRIWLCRNYACERPVESVVQLTSLINSKKASN